MAPRFRIAGVTFDFWQTLFMDTSELDRRRDELRCQGLKANLAKLGVEISFEDLADGLRVSMPWLARHLAERGGQVSTFVSNRTLNPARNTEGPFRTNRPPFCRAS